MYEVDTTVLGGLPVTVAFDVGRAEPDVGIFGRYVDDWHIVAIGGKPCKKADWLYKRINATKGEEDRIIEACEDAM